MIITVTGKNLFGAASKLSELKAEFMQEHSESGIVELSAEEVTYKDLEAAASAQGLFSTGTMIVLLDISKNKYFQEQLVDRMSKIPEESQIVIYEPSIDRRSAFFKKLKSDTVYHDFPPLNERDLANWTVEKYLKLGGKINYGDALFLAQRVNLDQWAVCNELEKLINMEQPIGRDLIKNVVDESFDETIFNLLEMAFSKRAEQAVTAYRDLLKNRMEPQYVLSMIIWQLHILNIIAHAGDRSSDQIASDHKLSPFLISKSMALMNKSSRVELSSVIDLTARIDLDSKTKNGYNVNAAVDLLIAKIAS